MRLVRALGPRLALVAMAVVLFSGCIRAEIGVRLDDDGSGTATVLFAFKESFLDLMGELGDGETDDFDPREVFSDIDQSQLPSGTKVESYDADGFVGSRMTMPFKDVSELGNLLGFVTSGASVPTDPGSDEGGFERFNLERTEDGWRLDAVAAPLATEEDIATADDSFTKTFLEDASFTIKIRLPGKIKEHNADKVEGNQLIWNLDFESTEARPLRAVSIGSGSGSSDGPPWVLIAGVAVGVVALGGIAWDVNRRRQARTA